MIFADKLIRLRKKSGWSQEELADQMGVSRQSVSKWEGAQSIPDLEKILRLSQLFGVSTDYLLKDEIECAEPLEPAVDAPQPDLRRVTMEEASTFLQLRADNARTTAFGVFLCVSAACWLLLMLQLGIGTPREGIFLMLGLVLLIVQITVAVGLFLMVGSRLSRFSFLEQESFETEYGVTGMVRARQEAFQPSYFRGNLVGVLLCVLSVVPLFFTLAICSFTLVGVILLLLMVATGVFFLVMGGSVWGSYQILLQEGAYTQLDKKLGRVYWTVVLGIYLVYSLLTGKWTRSWVIWLMAVCLYPLVRALCRSRA